MFSNKDTHAVSWYIIIYPYSSLHSPKPVSHTLWQCWPPKQTRETPLEDTTHPIVSDDQSQIRCIVRSGPASIPQRYTTKLNVEIKSSCSLVWPTPWHSYSISVTVCAWLVSFSLIILIVVVDDVVLGVCRWIVLSKQFYSYQFQGSFCIWMICRITCANRLNIVTTCVQSIYCR